MMLFLLDQLTGEFQRGANVFQADAYSRCTSSKVIPPARLPTTMETGSRVPRITGLPWQTFGSITIRSFIGPTYNSRCSLTIPFTPGTEFGITVKIVQTSQRKTHDLRRVLCSRTTLSAISRSSPSRSGECGPWTVFNNSASSSGLSSSKPRERADRASPPCRRL